MKKLKIETETIKKTQKDTILEMESLKMKSGLTNISITNRLQEMEERISGTKDTIENVDLTVRENAKIKKYLI